MIPSKRWSKNTMKLSLKQLKQAKGNLLNQCVG
jgi:hypothetical protein